MEKTLIDQHRAAEIAGVTTRTIARWRVRGWLTSEGTHSPTGAALYDYAEVANLAAWHAARKAPTGQG